MVEIHRLNGALGAVVDGVQLEEIDDAEFAALHGALLAHQVVFVRGQRLSDAGHRVLAARFGTPSLHPITAQLGGTDFLATVVDSADSPPDADEWHTDVAWTETPPELAILCAMEIPEFGGDTLWVDLYGAYARLSPAMQSFVGGLEVLYTPGEEFWAFVAARMAAGAPDDVLAGLKAAFPGVAHPLVRTHPETGRKALFVSDRSMHEIVGMHADESALLIDWLRGRVDDPNLQVRWSWRPGDVAIWDERCTNHRALSDHYPQRRVMRRCTVGARRVA
jgi:taurine dioxygenase